MFSYLLLDGVAGALAKASWTFVRRLKIELFACSNVGSTELAAHRNKVRALGPCFSRGVNGTVLFVSTVMGDIIGRDSLA